MSFKPELLRTRKVTSPATVRDQTLPQKSYEQIKEESIKKVDEILEAEKSEER